MNQTDQLRNHHHVSKINNQHHSGGRKSPAKEDLVSFTRNEGFITQPPEDTLLQPFGANAETDGDKDDLD